jgi:hypothetical protein
MCIVLRRLELALLATWLVGCAALAPTATPLPPPEATVLKAAPWPEAEALFRQDPRWRGGDDAYSIDLGDGRVLWLFGDSFIAPGPPYTRRDAIMVRNSVAIQKGYDPTTAKMAFYWRSVEYLPASFFPEAGDVWFWPGHGIVVEGKLTLFLMAIRESSRGLGFEPAGWRAVSVPNPEDPPPEWNLRWLETPSNPYGLVVSGSVLRHGDHVLAYCAREPAHDIHLVRWRLDDVVADDLSRPEWWAGDDAGWVPQGNMQQAPEPLFRGGQTEFTVHREARLGRLLEIQTVGFPKGNLGFRQADGPTGPWTSLRLFYQPKAEGIPRFMVYAAKAHPHLTGADLVVTYATSSLDFYRLVADERLYYPRVLRVDIGWRTRAPTQ